MKAVGESGHSEWAAQGLAMVGLLFSASLGKGWGRWQCRQGSALGYVTRCPLSKLLVISAQ